MKVRKYTARTSRDALRQVREDLGPDAVILANRMVRGGVEIMAMAAAEMLAQKAANDARTAARAALESPLEVGIEDIVATAADRADPAGELSSVAARGRALLSRMAEVAAAADGVQPAIAPRRAPEPAPAHTPIHTPTLGLKPAPAPLAAPRLGLRPAPTSGAPSPAVLRRRSPRAATPTGAAAAFQAGARVRTADPTLAAGDEPALAHAELDALALRHDPLMAALAEEVKSLGSMLGQATRPATSSAHRSANGFGGLGPVEPAPAIGAAPRGVEAVEEGSAAGGDAWMRNMMGELRSMRVLIEDQMGAMAFGDSGRMPPGKARVVRILSAAGFSAALIRKLTARLPESIAEAEALAFVRHALAANLSVAGSEAELLDQGGVFALVGPTGAGKTTTAAKLAARFVVRHGAENLALLTTDGYRIGGQEQLRIYGKILGVAVHAVKDAEDLRRTLGELRNRKLVLIDTVGLSQRDRLVAEQHELFARCGTPVKRLLLINATCHGDTLSDVVRAYRGDGLAGCILTKLDEAAALGAALDTAIRQRMRVFYAADGQRVPEDLHLAGAPQLVDRALQGVSVAARLDAAESDFPFELPPVHPGVVARGKEGEVAHG